MKENIIQKAVDLTINARGDNLTWPHADAIIRAVHEELQEVQTAENADHREEELGDVLWAVIGLACHYEIDPERALTRSVDKFAARWQKIRKLAEKDGVILSHLDEKTLDDYWKKAKISI